MASLMEEVAVKYFGEGYKPLQLTREIANVLERFFKNIHTTDEQMLDAEGKATKKSDEQMLKEVGEDIEMQDAMRCYLLCLTEEEWPLSFARVSAFDELY